MPTFSELITKKDRSPLEDAQLSDAAQAMEGLLWDLEQLLQRSAPAGRISFDKLGIHIRAGTSDTRRPEIQFIAGGRDALHTGRVAGYSTDDNEAGIYLTVNGYYDGTNWNLDDTAKNGAIYNQGGGTIAHDFRYIPSGSNPRTPVGLLRLYNDGGGFIWNESGGDHDFRVDGDTVAGVLKVDAGKDVAYLRGIGARVYNDANISINANTTTALTFNQERFDTDTIHDTGSNTNRLTATTAGVYSIWGQANWAAHATGYRGVQLTLNGTTAIADTLINASAVPNNTPHQFVSTIYELSATDYIELDVYQNSGGALNVTANANFSPEFSMVKVA